jgi:hypothetical protein
MITNEVAITAAATNAGLSHFWEFIIPVIAADPDYISRATLGLAHSRDQHAWNHI